MINRYLGNKTVILDEILEEVGAWADPGDLVCDVFSGSLSVSLALKRSGYRVATNDINLFSGMLGQAFLLNDCVPSFELPALVGVARARSLTEAAATEMAEYAGRSGFDYLVDEANECAAIDFSALLLFLQEERVSDQVPDPYRRSDFFDHYCEEGRNSAFVSSRGRTGRRRFFTSENARHIDAILNRLRYWHFEGRLDASLRALLLAVLMGAIERVSNTQGTYHDFPRDEYDPRAHRPLRLALPALDGLIGTGSDHLVGTAEDSLDFILTVPEHKVLYIDPPYNFRQYTAYYFMHNLICSYPTLQDPDEYFSGVLYVRGQNPSDDFVSSFCKPKHFIPSLQTLIERARTEVIVMSYFDGRNHWNDFKTESNGEGYRRLTEFFSSDLFEPGSLRTRPVERLNYQSYGGYRARSVSEYLFVAEKKN